MEHLKFTIIEGNALTFQNGLIIQKVRGGSSKVRKDIVGSPILTTASLQLNPQQYNEFMAFYNVLINQGSDAFTNDMMVDGWIVERQQIQIVSELSANFEGLTAYIDFQIEVNPRVIDDNYKILSPFVYYYNNENKIFNIIEKFVNFDLMGDF